MEAKKETPVPRRAYEKPQLEVIELATEEVLGTGCWADTSPTPGLACGFSQGCMV